MLKIPTPKTILLAGQPHEELTKYAVVHDIDLIVLGVRGHGLVETLFVGQPRIVLSGRHHARSYRFDP